MKISVLCANLSSNCLGRAYILAKVLNRHWPVEIVEPLYDNSIWYPVAHDTRINYVQVRASGSVLKYREIKELVSKISGDVVYASKPLMTSFGTGLIKKIFSKKPLILDIDDWEYGIVKNFYLKLSGFQKAENFIASFRDGYAYWNIVFLEKLVKFADNITVSNSFLCNKFPGATVPHGRDTDLLDPKKYDRAQLRERLGLNGKNI